MRTRIELNISGLNLRTGHSLGYQLASIRDQPNSGWETQDPNVIQG